MFFINRRKLHQHTHLPRKINLGYVITIFCVLFLLLLPAAYSLLTNIKDVEAWYTAGGTWQYRKRLVIDDTKVAGTANFTNFPVLVKMTDPQLAQYAQSDGDDILFTNAAGTKLDHELESYTSSTGDLVAWVEVDILDGDEDTVLYMYYGDNSVASQQNPTGVWGGYLGTWHLNETVTDNVSTANIHQDSTSSNEDGDQVNNVNVTGKIANAQEFDNSGDYVNVGTTSVYDVNDTEDLVISGWFLVDTIGSMKPVVARKPNAINISAGYYVFISSTGDLRFQVSDGGGVSDTASLYEVDTTVTFSVATWYHFVAVWDQDNATNTEVYINGVADGNNTGTIGNIGSLTSVHELEIGSESDETISYGGSIDEIRVTKTIPSNTADYVATEYANQNSPSTFFLVQGQETQNGVTQPVLYFKFDEGVDNSCAGGTNDTCDNSLNQNDGAISNGTLWQKENSCVSGKCLYFDGTNDIITLTNTSTIDFDNAVGDEFTYSFWVKANSAGESSLGEIFQKGSVTYCRTSNLASNAVDLECSFGQATDATITVTGGLTLSTWHHVAITYDDDGDDEITVYIDGKNRGSSTNGVGPPDADSSNLLVGGNTNFHGFIDEFKIFDISLDEALIRTQMIAGASARGSSAVLGKASTDFLTQGLLAYYPMDELAANSCTGGVNDTCDYSGGGFDMSWAGTPTAVPSYFNGYSVSFGNTDLLSVGDNSRLEPIGGITVSAWVYLTSFTPSEDYTIINKMDSDSSISYRLRLLDASSGRVKWSIGTDSDGLTGTVDTTVNTLTHIAATYDGKIARIYVNGKIDTEAAKTWAFTNTTNPLVIGAKGSSANDYFEGGLDDIRLYNRAMQESEVAQLYAWHPDPIFDLQMDENTGTTTKDSSTANVTSSTFTGNTTWAQGKYGSALRFDGTDDNVRFVENSRIDLGAISESYSLSGWFKTTTNSATNVVIAGKQISTGSAYPYVIYLDSSEFGCFALRDSSANTPFVCGATALNDGNWHHIAGVRDVQNDVIRVFIDGVQVSTATDTTIASSANNDDFSIGNSGTTYTQFDFNGDIDNVHLFWSAMDAGAVIRDLNGTHPLGGSPIGSQVGYWNFDEGAQTITNNQNSLFPTLTGTTSNTTWKNSESCKINKCLDFNGTTSVVTVTNANPIDFDLGLKTQVSFSGWINADTAGEGSGGQIFQKGTNNWCRTDTLSGGRLDLECSLDLVTTDATLNISQVITVGAWHHIVVAYNDDADDEITVYVDGKSRGSSTNGVGGPATGDASNLLIGGTTTDNFDGRIDEFKVYSAELSSTDVLIDKNANSAVDFNSKERDVDDLTGGAGNPPVLEWNFDENTGSTAKDISGNTNDGTILNATFTQGKVGSALRFTTTVAESVIKTTPVNLPANNGSQSIAYWYKIDANIVGPSVAVNLLGAGASGLQCGFRSSLVNCWKNGGTTLVNVTAPTAGLWHHIMYTFDGTNHSLYLNGILVSTSVVAADTGAASDFQVGYNSDATAEDWENGEIDQVKVWNYEMTQAQVSYDYNRGKPIGHWKLDEVVGNTANDSSGNSYTGTWVNLETADATEAKYNKGLDLDGTNENLTVADTANLRFDAVTGDFSVFSWVKRDTNGTMYVVSKEDADNDGWRMMFTSGNAVQCSVDAIDVTSSSTITDTKWHHIGCTIDRDGNGQIYIDGLANGTAGAISSEVMANTSAMTFGTRSYTSTSYLDGMIDEIQIYNYVVGPTQILNIMNSTAIRFGPESGSP